MTETSQKRPVVTYQRGYWPFRGYNVYMNFGKENRYRMAWFLSILDAESYVDDKNETINLIYNRE